MDKIFVMDKKYFVIDKIILSRTNLILSRTKNILSRQMDRAYDTILEGSHVFWHRVLHAVLLSSMTKKYLPYK